jgi:hypothetical protein
MRVGVAGMKDNPLIRSGRRDAVALEVLSSIDIEANADGPSAEHHRYTAQQTDCLTVS